jgi:multiple sugar transport system ATP-binding protein
MNVEQNIGFGLKLSTKLSSAEIDDRVENAARMLGIADLLADKPRELSGGQQQRVALGRAIVRQPAAFLMDEPLSNLDAKLRSTMRTEIQELQHDLGTTTLYVTHDQTEAMAMGDRIAVLDGGRLQQVGEPEELYLSPTNEFVGNFIGSPSMNVLTTEVERTDGTGVRLVGPGEFVYDLEDASPIGDRDRVRLGVRPEDMRLGRTGGSPVSVAVVEPMGDENYVYLELDTIELTARVGRGVRPTVEETVRFDFEEDALYLFDADSGAALTTKTDAEGDFDSVGTDEGTRAETSEDGGGNDRSREDETDAARAGASE